MDKLWNQTNLNKHLALRIVFYFGYVGVAVEGSWAVSWVLKDLTHEDRIAKSITNRVNYYGTRVMGAFK